MCTTLSKPSTAKRRLLCTQKEACQVFEIKGQRSRLSLKVPERFREQGQNVSGFRLFGTTPEGWLSPTRDNTPGQFGPSLAPDLGETLGAAGSGASTRRPPRPCAARTPVGALRGPAGAEPFPFRSWERRLPVAPALRAPALTLTGRGHFGELVSRWHPQGFGAVGRGVARRHRRKLASGTWGRCFHSHSGSGRGRARRLAVTSHPRAQLRHKAPRPRPAGAPRRACAESLRLWKYSPGRLLRRDRHLAVR